VSDPVEAADTAWPLPSFSGTESFILDDNGLDSLAEPAAVVDGQGRLVAANPLFNAELGLAAPSAAELSPSLLAQLPLLTQEARRVRCLVTGTDAAERIFDLTAAPLANAGLWLLLASDVTVEVHLRNALVESRARYMDLVGLSGEWAWETTADGKFGIVTADGLAGRMAKELVGTEPVLLFDPSMPPLPISPFTTPSRLDGVDLWLRHVDGHPRCYRTAAVPLYDGAGVWRGARGLCRDISQEQRDRAFLADLRHRERLFARITGVFRSESNPDDMLRVATDACANGFGADGCQIYIGQQRLSAGPVALSLLVAFGECGEAERVAGLLETLADERSLTPRRLNLGPWSLLAAPCVYGGRLLGAILLWRGESQSDWSEGEAELLDAVAGQVAAAIEQRANYNLLLDASRTDPLTGLSNRRAFDEEMRRRFHRLEREDKTAALVYVDLDNFKLVNDVHGHDVGDEALRHLADILRSNTRSTDLVARLGGDEFAVWLEQADDKVAIKRARIFLTAAAPLVKYSGSTERPLKLSIGVAVYDPRAREDIAAFVKRADAAMYQVKRSGKGSYALAPSPRNSR
jgi:diguanylate cyclase (GGDEF)-like protein